MNSSDLLLDDSKLKTDVRALWLSVLPHLVNLVIMAHPGVMDDLYKQMKHNLLVLCVVEAFLKDRHIFIEWLIQTK